MNEYSGKTIIYLASPYAHKDPAVMQKRYEAVTAKAIELVVQGLHIYSPITHNHPLTLSGKLGRTWADWEEYDLAFLRVSKELYVLKQEGWSKSVGVTAEITFATANNIKVTFIKP